MCECYTSGGDAQFELAPPKIIGQTFSPLVDHKLEFIDLNLRRRTLGGVTTVTLYDLAEDPDMIGGGIARTKAVDWPRHWPWEVNRVRFKMSSVTLHPDHTYGILVRSDPAPWWNYHYVQYDAADATYPRGQRFTKDGILDPPTYYPDSDLIFAEFGTPVAPPIPPNPPPEPPPVPPDPPIQNWLIINSAQERTLTGEKITIYTNVPCHLWMRYTLINPKIHKITRLRRGLAAMEDWYFCFDVYIDNDQEEAGDTLVHTFIKEPWPYCEERWYYFHGNVNGIPSPSTSPIFYKHPQPPLIPPPVPFCSRISPAGKTNTWYGPYEWACSFKPCQTYYITAIGYKWQPAPDSPIPAWMRYCIYANGPDNKPTGLPIASTGTKTPPWPTSKDVFTIWDFLAPVILEADVIYWHVIHTGEPETPGYDYIWSQNEPSITYETCPSGISEAYGYRRYNNLVDPPQIWKSLTIRHQYQTFGYTPP